MYSDEILDYVYNKNLIESDRYPDINNIDDINSNSKYYLDSLNIYKQDIEIVKSENILQYFGYEFFKKS